MKKFLLVTIVSTVTGLVAYKRTNRKALPSVAQTAFPGSQI